MRGLSAFKELLQETKKITDKSLSLVKDAESGHMAEIIELLSKVNMINFECKSWLFSIPFRFESIYPFRTSDIWISNRWQTSVLLYWRPTWRTWKRGGHLHPPQLQNLREENNSYFFTFWIGSNFTCFPIAFYSSISGNSQLFSCQKWLMFYVIKSKIKAFFYYHC